MQGIILKQRYLSFCWLVQLYIVSSPLNSPDVEKFVYYLKRRQFMDILSEISDIYFIHMTLISLMYSQISKDKAELRYLTLDR